MKELKAIKTHDGRTIIYLSEDDIIEVVEENGEVKAYFDHYEEPDHAGWADDDDNPIYV